MFGRYTDECKRAVFFAQQSALYKSAIAIDSGHLLLGLLSEKDTRADIVFRLRELLPEDAAQQIVLIKQKPMKGTIPLSKDGKRIVAYTAREANSLQDYWIDTEHLVLGILRDADNTAAGKLRSLGFDIKTARQRVVENKNSRASRPNPVLWWVRRRPLGVALSVAFVIGVITALYLFGYVGTR
jgi:ATP-dependent Clp protease ATP-binding subunit ClpC